MSVQSIHEQRTNADQKEPFFSVCIPVYNSRLFIEKTVKSILDQEFNNFEILIVDDNSSDDSYDIVDKLAKDNKKIKLFKNNNNMGPVRNWNECIRKSKGKYIAFCHHDDEFKPSYLKTAHLYLTKYSNIGIFATGSLSIKNRKIIKANRRPRTGLIQGNDYFDEVFTMKNVSPPSETIFIREHGKEPFFYDESYNYCPEVDLYLRIAEKGYDVYHHDGFLVLRKYNAESITSRFKDTFIPIGDEIKVLQKYRFNKKVDENTRNKAETRLMYKYFIFMIGNMDTINKDNSYIDNFIHIFSTKKTSSITLLFIFYFFRTFDFLPMKTKAILKIFKLNRGI